MQKKFKIININLKIFIDIFLLLILVPASIFIGFYILGEQYYYLISFFIIFISIISIFINFNKNKLNSLDFIILSVFIALTVVSRTLFFITPQFKPIISIVIISGICLNGRSAFLVGAISAFISNFLFGQGPWTIWQMFALGFVGFLAGLIFHYKISTIKNKDVVIISLFGIVATFIYSYINNFGFLIMTKTSISFESFLSSCILSFPLDIILAIATFLFLILLIKPINKVLDRMKTKFIN